MTPELFVDVALAPGLRLLPLAMDTVPARALLLSIALQESALKARRQTGGPARSYFQFEPTGIAGVLKHKATAPYATSICTTLDIPATVTFVYRAIEYHDPLACVFARLLLWTLPTSLPTRDDADGAWTQYLRAWRPGKPHPAIWTANYARAWALMPHEADT